MNMNKKNKMIRRLLIVVLGSIIMSAGISLLFKGRLWGRSPVSVYIRAGKNNRNNLWKGLCLLYVDAGGFDVFPG